MTITNQTTVTNYTWHFNILISLAIPSIIVSFIIFIHVVSDRTLRTAYQQHSIFLLLTINFIQSVTDIPITMKFYHAGGVMSLANDDFCKWWTLHDYTMYGISAFLMAWISIERHLLIFHDRLLGPIGSWKRWAFHFVPWSFSMIWSLMFYAFAILISPMCINEWHDHELFCGQPCYLSTAWGTGDIFANIVFPVLVILIANLLLIGRILSREFNVVIRRHVQWRQHRKMVLQLLVLSITYIAIWVPVAIIQLCQLYIDSNSFNDELDLFNYIALIGPLILPFICVPSIPQLIPRIKKIFKGRQTITPLN